MKVWGLPSLYKISAMFLSLFVMFIELKSTEIKML